MSMTPAVWALAGAALFAVAPARAQTAAPTVLPCAGETPRTFEPPVNRGAQDDPADWSQEQVNAQPKGEQMRDNATYRRQVTALYQQHLAVYAGQLRKFADDKALHEQFKAGFNGAKLAVAQQANANIARGAEPVDPNNGVATLVDPARQSPVSHTPIEHGNRDLAALATNVTTDRAAMTHTCEMLVEDRKILDRIDSAR